MPSARRGWAVSDYYAKSLPGNFIYRAEVRRRTSEKHHAIICTCYEVETAERIAAALNAQAGVVPDAMPEPSVTQRTDYTEGYTEGWNNCRAAMLAAANKENNNG